MAITGLQYWFDGQQRRFLEQVVRAFSGFQYMTGRKADSEPVLRMVPCRIASFNRMVGNIMRNNSENTLISCPMITVWQESLAQRRNDLQNTAHVDTLSVHERAIDPVTGQYTGESGNRYTVRRLMPRPFEMGIRVDIWTSNLDQKHQLSEQMLTVFSPDISIQNGENPIDWTAKTVLTLDDIQWSSRSMPVGGDDEIDVMTLQFKLPMWLSPPAEVTSQKIIQQVVTNIHSSSEILDTLPTGQTADTLIVTPGNHRIFVDIKDGTLKLLGPKGAELDDNGNAYKWSDLFASYGNLRPTLSEIRIKRDLDIESENNVVGSIQYVTGQPNMLFWSVDPDTLPTNTLPPIKGVINPLSTFAGNGLVPLDGDRFLITEDIGPSAAWGNISASANDIVQYNAGTWLVVFDASITSSVQHVVNTFSSTQLRWTGYEWVLSVGGEYGPGYWRIHL